MGSRPATPKSPAVLRLTAGSTVAVLGGGPAGAFFALHLLSKARAAGLDLNVLVFERSRHSALAPGPGCPGHGPWHGCNYCAGGISPQLMDVLKELGIPLPESVIQSRIRHLVIQGYWKNIELEVPPNRQIVGVFRGARPASDAEPNQSFDSHLLEQALRAGARLVPEEVRSVSRGEDGKPWIVYGCDGSNQGLAADLVVFATGVNENPNAPAGPGRMLASARELMPGFVPPRTRQTLVFELGARPHLPAALRQGLVFVEYGSKALPVEMSSFLPKRRCLTVVLVGRCVDRLPNPAAGWTLMRAFLKLPHIQRLFSPATPLPPVCFCMPNLVVAPARHPYGDRISAVGDLVTARLYKDGILSAHQTARALAATVMERGIDETSLHAGYGPTLDQFALDNHCARLVFLVHRLFFGSSILSRVLYQAVISERKTRRADQRPLEHILWRIASGDDTYRSILRSILEFRTAADLFTGAVVTLRNYLTELAFGLRWAGIGRFTTGVALERWQEKRRAFAALVADAHVAVPERLEFESMYTIRIDAPQERIVAELEEFGEPDRAYLKPRGVRIRRVAGDPHSVGCTIRYVIGLSWFSFDLRLERIVDGHLLVYRVLNGFARGGVLLFEIERTDREDCLLSIYVAFNFPRGRSALGRPLWALFRNLFPAYVHDVLWNHSLCQLKESVEQG